MHCTHREVLGGRILKEWVQIQDSYRAELFLAASMECSAGSNDHFVVVVVVVADVVVVVHATL
jgi:hypothetical protein